MSAVAEQVVPHNLDAEMSVLGAVLASHGKALDLVADSLKPAAFFRDAHRWIYESMLVLYRRGDAVDFITLNAELRRHKRLDAVGGPAYVSKLADGVPSSTNVAYYARLIAEAASKRQVIDLARRLLTKAYAPDTEPGELVEEAERGLLAVSEQASPGDLVPASELVRRYYPVIEQMQQGEPDMGVATGFPTLDKYTLGFGVGETVILAGLTSAGKTSLAMQIATHIAKDAPVAYFSLEMTERQQFLRIISALARVDGHKMRLGRLEMFEQQRVGGAMAEFSESNFWLDGTPAITAMQVRSRARRLKAKQGRLGLIVVDYLQKMRHPPADRHDLRVAASSEILSHIARELETPALVLSQFSRGVAKDGREPQLSDLRDSGAIEQDAGMVLLLHRPAAKDESGDAPATKLIVAKQRNGPKTDVDLVWLGEQYRFVEMEQRS